MHDVLTQAWKVAALALALIPGVFGVVHFMVNAKVEAVESRLGRVEVEIDKGERFTLHDGDVLQANINNHISVHDKEIDQLREVLGKIRFDDATCKANVLSLNTRFQRLEDRVYTMDLHPRQNMYKNAPYKMPLEPYDQLWPAAIHKDFN